MKRFIKVVLILTCLALLLCGMAHAEASSDLPSQIQSKVLNCDLRVNRKTGNTLIGVKTRFTNQSDIGIMEIQYTISVLDRGGKVLGHMDCVFNGLDTPIAPGKTAVHEDGWQDKLDGKAHHVEITIRSVRSEAELPPVHLPLPGEPLYQALSDARLSALADELPVQIEMWFDRGGDQSIARLTDEASIREAVGLFQGVTIAKETQEWVTDNYNGLRFTFADGSRYTISLNLWSLEIHPYGELRLYELDNLSPFRTYMWERAVSDGGAENAGS